MRSAYPLSPVLGGEGRGEGRSGMQNDECRIQNENKLTVAALFCIHHSSFCILRAPAPHPCPLPWVQGRGGGALYDSRWVNYWGAASVSRLRRAGALRRRLGVRRSVAGAAAN